jgi:CDP-diacylglycerol---glycerol-3-phosphate 3-phosphatidyltransferase
MNLANKLTVVRVLLIPVFLMFLLGNFFDETVSRYMAVFIFIVASLTDALDGYIARSRNLVTNIGKFMDPLADKLLVCSALIAMVELGDLPSWVVIIIISRGFWGKIKTIVQMVMIVVVLLQLDNVYYTLFANSLIIASVVLTAVSGIEYIYSNIHVLEDRG